jgi:hypothetical protein
MGASSLFVWCPERDSNPHTLTDTWPSTMPVYQFQHPGGYVFTVRCAKLKE